VRRFACERCLAECPFGAFQCPTCGVALGYLSEPGALRALETGPSDAEYTVAGGDTRWWRCLNAAWGCNWMLPAEGTDVWCRSCRLTRGRPDESDRDALDAWASAEAAKRHLVHQLDALGLPIEERTASTPLGLAFDLVHLPGEPEVTGHLRGVITLDLTESDEGHRDDLRRRFGEPLRTLIGHLRHEIGHYYWSRLLPSTDLPGLEAFRALFGDERSDYGSALAAHHGAGPPPWDRVVHVTPYAASHPLEDWAETFAHYLHMRDALETADAFELQVPGPEPRDDGFTEMLVRWQPVADGINAVAASLGSPALYPLSPSGVVVEKLSFVHDRVSALEPTVPVDSAHGSGHPGRSLDVEPPADPWGLAVADFLTDLLDDVVVEVRTDRAHRRSRSGHATEHRGADGRRREFSFVTTSSRVETPLLPAGFPDELNDLPDAAFRALDRAVSPDLGALARSPSMARAIHEVIVAEVLADRLSGRDGSTAPPEITQLVADTLSYFSVLAGTSLEGQPVKHGVVVAGDRQGLEAPAPVISYPGQLPARKRTPLLFDGAESVLVISTAGLVLRSLDRESLAHLAAERARSLESYDGFPGLDGALTAAASDLFDGIGIHLRPDRSTWIFDRGEPLFVRRTDRWKSIAVQSFARSVAALGPTSPVLAERFVRAALRLSVEGHGGLLAVAPDVRSVATVIEPKDRLPIEGADLSEPTADDDLRRLIWSATVPTVEDLVRLGRIDGATVTDTNGQVMAFGAIVRSFGSRAEGARAAAARSLSKAMSFAICVSQDGPITVFHDGQSVLEVL